TCTATIYIDDTADPVIDCPDDLVLECDGDYLTEIAAWLATATATDVCDQTVSVTNDWDGTSVPLLSCDLSSGLTITFTAMDDCNNTATCTATIFLDDNVNPTITFCPADITIEC